MALSSQGCEAPGDMSSLVPQPWPGRAHPSSPAGSRVWERPHWRGCHLLLSLSLSWLFQSFVEAVMGEGPGGTSVPVADSEHHQNCPGDEAAMRVKVCPRPGLFSGCTTLHPSQKRWWALEHPQRGREPALAG